MLMVPQGLSFQWHVQDFRVWVQRFARGQGGSRAGPCRCSSHLLDRVLASPKIWRARKHLPYRQSCTSTGMLWLKSLNFPPQNAQKAKNQPFLWAFHQGRLETEVCKSPPRGWRFLKSRISALGLEQFSFLSCRRAARYRERSYLPPYPQ